VETPDLTWPPSTEQLQNEEYKPPNSLYTFLTFLFKHSNRGINLTNFQERMVDSVASDLVYKEKSIQLKHFLLAIGLHDFKKRSKKIQQYDYSIILK